MPDLSFSLAERRTYTAPALIAFAVLLAAIAFFFWRNPLLTPQLAVTHANTLPTRTVFPSGTRLVGVPDPAEDAFYVLATVHIHNPLHVPLFIKDITGTLTAPDGSVETASAIEKNDLPNLYVSFPKLKPLASSPLLRETTIPAGADAEGMVILNFPVGQENWDKRKSATVTMDFYHQGQFTTEIPNP